MARSIQFVVHGKPATSGSKRAYVRYQNGVPRAALVKDNKRQEPFMAAIAASAAKAARGMFWHTEALRLEIDILRVRPRSHYGSGRNANVIKTSAPSWPTSKPDSLKICRAIEDAMTGVVYRDDSQICSHRIRKSYGESDKTIVRVSEIPPTEEGQA